MNHRGTEKEEKETPLRKPGNQEEEESAFSFSGFLGESLLWPFFSVSLCLCGSFLG
jgi:hypothetical protein